MPHKETLAGEDLRGNRGDNLPGAWRELGQLGRALWLHGHKYFLWLHVSPCTLFFWLLFVKYFLLGGYFTL